MLSECRANMCPRKTRDSGSSLGLTAQLVGVSEVLPCAVLMKGSARHTGTAIVTMDKALMFTDGRYYIQARQQMDEQWDLMKVGMPGVPTPEQYLQQV